MILCSNIASTLFSSCENENTCKPNLLLIDIHVYTGQVGMRCFLIFFFPGVYDWGCSLLFFKYLLLFPSMSKR